MAELLRPTALELASGVVLGHVDPAPPAASSHPPVDPLEALERAILPALRRPPCVVSFSGGMDSSFVLAVATRLAARGGLPPPVPVTWRFTGAPRAEESHWQERVVAALGLPSWQVLHADDDLDLVGPVAQRVLRRHGALHPANVHLHLPIIETTPGGSMLTGAGGDQVLAGFRPPGSLSPVRALRARVPARVVDLRRRREDGEELGWLHRPLSRRLASAYRRQVRSEPRRLDRRLRWHVTRRDVVMACSSLQAVAEDADVTVVNPLLDATFVSSLAHHHGSARGLTREALLRRISGEVLPPEATAARPKAWFREVFMRGPSRELARTWAGHGLDPTVVDLGALARLWAGPDIPGGTGALLQQVWMHQQRQRSTTEVRG